MNMINLENPDRAPKGEGVSDFTPYWMTKTELNALSKPDGARLQRVPFFQFCQ